MDPHFVHKSVLDYLNKIGLYRSFLSTLRASDLNDQKNQVKNYIVINQTFDLTWQFPHVTYGHRTKTRRYHILMRLNRPIAFRFTRYHLSKPEK